MLIDFILRGLQNQYACALRQYSKLYRTHIGMRPLEATRVPIQKSSHEFWKSIQRFQTFSVDLIFTRDILQFAYGSRVTSIRIWHLGCFRHWLRFFSECSWRMALHSRMQYCHGLQLEFVRIKALSPSDLCKVCIALSGSKKEACEKVKPNSNKHN